MSVGSEAHGYNTTVKRGIHQMKRRHIMQTEGLLCESIPLQLLLQHHHCSIPALECCWKSVSGRPRTRTRESLRSQLPLPLSRCPTTESPPSSEHTHTYKRERKKKKFIGIVATTQKQRHERKSDYERETICS